MRLKKQVPPHRRAPRAPGGLLASGGITTLDELRELAAAGVAAVGGRVLYATGEESAAQISDRADRLGLMGGPAAEAVEILAEHDAELIGEATRSGRPALLIVDSIQTATVDALDGVAGSVGQVRESAAVLAVAARETGAATILVGHVTKEGWIAGPKTLEHLVDGRVVNQITVDADTSHWARVALDRMLALPGTR